MIESSAVWDTLRELKDKTKIAHYGISIGKPEEGLLAIEKGEVETIQVVYNLLQREAARELFEEAYKKSVGIIVRVPLASGLLTGKYDPGHRFPDNDHRKDTYPPEKLAALLARVEKLRFLAAGHRPHAGAGGHQVLPGAPGGERGHSGHQDAGTSR